METIVVNRRTDDFDVYIGRGSKWGNPFTHIKTKTTKAKYLVDTRQEAIDKYREWILKQKHLLADLHELKGKKIACYCKPKSCHGDILVELIKDQNTYSIF